MAHSQGIQRRRTSVVHLCKRAHLQYPQRTQTQQRSNERSAPRSRRRTTDKVPYTGEEGEPAAHSLCNHMPFRELIRNVVCHGLDNKPVGNQNKNRHGRKGVVVEVQNQWYSSTLNSNRPKLKGTPT